jgi:hypothetical protein
MVFLLFARSIGTHPKGREGALLPSRGMAALPREEVFGKGPGACEGGRSPKPGVRGTRVLNAEPKGAAPAPKRWPSDRAKRRSCKTADLTLNWSHKSVRLQDEDGQRKGARRLHRYNFRLDRNTPRTQKSGKSCVHTVR